MNCLISFFGGLFIGVIFGFLTSAVLTAGRDEHFEEYEKKD